MYKHGVYAYESDTSITAPVKAATIPVVIGTAPVQQTADPAVNKPILCNTWKEAVDQLGYSQDWDTFTLCEFMKAHFQLYQVAPVVFINVLDPTTHKAVGETDTIDVVNKQAVLEHPALLATIDISNGAGGTYVLDTDYSAAYNDAGNVVITILDGGAVPDNTTTLDVTFDKVDITSLTTDDIIGGVDAGTGEVTGLELLNKVFPLFRLVPSLVAAPGWSHNADVAAVMSAKADNINGNFKADCLVDVPTATVTKYTDVPNWKTTNNYTAANQVVCWPKVKLGDDIYHLSTHLAGLMCNVDYDNDNVPYETPSNKSLQATGAVLADGTAVTLGVEEANYLNGEGVVTALNFVGGWKAWGSRTGAYSSTSPPDIKDGFLTNKRMMHFINNTVILTFWGRVDKPLNRRLIDTVLDSANIWLNGLTAREFLLGARIVLNEDENPVTDMADGVIKFRVYQASPPPTREIDFYIEYDPSYFQGLFQ